MSMLSDDDSPRKICKTSSVITDLPVECLTLIFQRLMDNRDDRNSFGLTCSQWLHIQNDNQESLWCLHNIGPTMCREVISNPKSFPKILCQLLSRFQNLTDLCLRRCSTIADFVPSELPFFESKVETLVLDDCKEFSNKELSTLFSWFPSLTNISLQKCCDITDEGLEALAKCCPSLKKVDLYWCSSITDSGISFLIQNCHTLGSLNIDSCYSITGIGFLGCPKSLTYLDAGGCKLKPEGINAIVSGGGLEYLRVSELPSKNTEAVVTISKDCPLLRRLVLKHSVVRQEGWEAIGRNCKNLEQLDVCGCRTLCELGLKGLCNECKKLSTFTRRWCRMSCDIGLEALCNGCNKLSTLRTDCHSFSKSALELFESKRPNCIKVLERW